MSANLSRPRFTCLWVLPVLAMLVLPAGCNRAAEFVPPPPMDVTVSKPIQKSVTDFADFSGCVEASASVDIRARVEGYLEKICFTSGARVKKGDLLFVIDPKPYQAKLDESKADLARRQAELANADAMLKRKDSAFKAKAVSEMEAIQAKADYEVAKANVQAAMAAIQTAELNLSYTKVNAPLSGKISRNLVDVGNLVGANERTLLATIVGDDPVYAYFTVNERDLLKYQQNKQLHESPTARSGKMQVLLGLSGQDGYPFEGRVDYMDNRLDRATGTIQVRGVFANSDHHLWPGLFARIRVPIGSRENALLVPDSAVGSDQRGDFLLVVNDQKTVEYRPVVTGALIGDMRVIESGISPEDRLIVTGLQRARPGLQVNPKEAATPLAQATPTRKAN